jgi:hypothetical protein
MHREQLEDVGENGDEIQGILQFVPVTALPQTLQSTCASGIIRTPRNIDSWSSAMRMLFGTGFLENAQDC